MKRHLHTEQTDAPGVFELNATGWDGRVFKMSRRAFFAWRRGSASVPATAAVYVLYANHFDKAKYGRGLYVGHTDNLRERADDHEVKKAFWTAALVFTSGGDWMDKAHSQNIEFAFIEMAQLAARYDVLNGNKGGPCHLGAHADLVVTEYLKPVREVLALAGMDVFEPSPDGIFTYTPTKPSRFRAAPVSRLKIKNFNPPQFEILAGSACPVLLPNTVTKHTATLGVVYDADARTISFQQDTVVSPDDSSGSLFGHSLRRYLNEQRRHLGDVLEAGTESGDFDESSDDDEPEAAGADGSTG